MIGAWRWILAVLVVVGHLYTPWWPASFGVFSFYIISGFLMALILNEHYGFSFFGFRGFCQNRLLKLYPAYFAACLMSILLIVLIPMEFVTEKNSKLILPATLYEFITNISILGLVQKESQSSLVPPAWALSIEIFYYFIISVWAGRSRRNALLFLIIAVLYLLAVYLFKEFNWWYRYYFVGAGALPFAVGVNVYFHLGSIKKAIDSFSWVRAFVFSLAFYISCFIGAFFLGHQNTWFFYLNILSSTLLLISLWHFPVSKYKELDSFMGDLSYPTYLFHWQVGVVVAYVSGITWKSGELFLISLVVVTAMSIVETKVVSGPIEQYRKKIKTTVGHLSKAGKF